MIWRSSGKSGCVVDAMKAMFARWLGLGVGASCGRGVLLRIELALEAFPAAVVCELPGRILFNRLLPMLVKDSSPVSRSVCTDAERGRVDPEKRPLSVDTGPDDDASSLGLAGGVEIFGPAICLGTGVISLGTGDGNRGADDPGRDGAILGAGAAMGRAWFRCDEMDEA